MSATAVLRALDRALYEVALKRGNGSQVHAAELLWVPRSRVANRVRRWRV